MKSAARRMHQAQHLASLAGVTVRTLHHYDRVGLLKPSGRTQAGYRLYSDSDLARLEQILVLRALGLPLKQIRELLDQKTHGLRQTLRMQLWALEEKRRRIDMAIQAVVEAESVAGSGREPDWEIFKKIFKVIEMQNNTDWMMRYYDDGARAKVENRKKLWSPELQEKVTKQWSELIADIEHALDEDPGSNRAQVLAERWRKLLEGFTGGDPQIQAGLNKMYADQKNWPRHFQKPFSDDVQAFMTKAMKAGKK